MAGNDNSPRILTADACGDLAPRMFAVDHGAEAVIPSPVARLLDPVDAGSMHYWALEKGKFPELHFHEHDEHWIWSRGRTRVTIRLPDGRSDSFEIGPGWIVYCVRGVEHSHEPLEDWACFECLGALREGARTGHLHRTL